VTPEERSHAEHQLRASAALIEAAVAGLTEAQLHFRPEPGVWSIAQCLHHVAQSESIVLSQVEAASESSPPPEQKDRDAFVERAVRSRSRRVQAPAAMEPGEVKTAAEDLLAAFRAVRARSIGLAQTGADLRRKTADHFALKTLDGYQWLLMVAAHAERHAAQMREARQHPAFPG